MAGETLREAAVLILVFGFMDAFLQQDEMRKAGLSAEQFARKVLILGVFFWVCGVLFERFREDDKGASGV